MSKHAWINNDYAASAEPPVTIALRDRVLHQDDARKKSSMVEGETGSGKKARQP